VLNNSVGLARFQQRSQQPGARVQSSDSQAKATNPLNNPNSLMNRSKSIHETKQSLDIDFNLQPKK